MILCSGSGAIVRAQPLDHELGTPSDTLEFRPVRDGIITGLGATFWVLEELVLRDTIAPNACRWCDRADGGSDTLNGFDAELRDGALWGDPGQADNASNFTGYLLAPALAFGLGAVAAGREGRLGEWKENSLVILEAVVIATAVNKATKLSFARQRPYAHFRTDQEEPIDPDENQSFTSGHTTLAFSLAVAGGTVASIRGYRTAPLVWGLGLTAAAATGYFRMAADKHYATDVLGGAVIGGAIGFAVPWFLARKDLPNREGPPPAPTVELRDGGVILGVAVRR